MTDDTIDIHDVKARHKNELAAIDGVVSVGVGEDEIVVGYIDATPGIKDKIPDELEGVPVRMDRIGEIGPEIGTHADITEDTGMAERTTRTRPIPGGVSIGHQDVTAGTSGFVMTAGTAEFIASNNHVLANVNDGTHGDPVFQPGPIHDGDHCGSLWEYVPVKDGVTVDFAWAKIRRNEISPEVVGVGGPYGDVYDPDPGDTLISSGITSGVSTAKVLQIDATVNVNFGDEIITLEEQIITESMSGPGDSGSPVLYEGRPAGMLFAGSDRVSVINSAENIEAESGLRIQTTDQPPATIESAMWTFPAKPYEANRWAEGVVDGDTYWITVDEGFHDTTTEKFRAMHIDTAEIWGNGGPDELEMAREQRDFVRKWMRDAAADHDGHWPLIVRTELARGDRERYLAEVYNRNEESLQRALIEEYGRDYLYEGTTLDELNRRLNNLTASL